MCLCVRDITVDRPTGEQYLGNHIIFLMLFCFIIVFSYDCQQQQQQQQIEELEGKQKMKNKEISVKDSSMFTVVYACTPRSKTSFLLSVQRLIDVMIEQE